MLALTLHRPWDTAILVLGKPVENRDWPPMPSVVGSRIALHSGLTWDGDGARFIFAQAVADGIPGTVVSNALDQAYRVKGAIIGTVKVAGVLRRDAPHPTDPLHQSPWFFGAFGWVCEQPIVLPGPVPCRGAQKLWKLPADVEARVLAQEAAR